MSVPVVFEMNVQNVAQTLVSSGGVIAVVAWYLRILFEVVMS
jgi:hypothetical protein